jgi:hypothetical protein
MKLKLLNTKQIGCLVSTLIAFFGGEIGAVCIFIGKETIGKTFTAVSFVSLVLSLYFFEKMLNDRKKLKL